MATGQKIQAKLWNPSEERAKGKTEVVYKLNSALKGRDDQFKPTAPDSIGGKRRIFIDTLGVDPGCLMRS